MPACKLCRKEVPKLAKSHIIPDAMSKDAAGDGRLLALRPEFVHPLKGGVYDWIVCPECEASFHRPDDYTIEFVRKMRRGMTLQAAIPESQLQLRTHMGDSDLLQRFALQTLLRARLSERQEFRRIVMTPEDTAALISVVRNPTTNALQRWPVAARFIRGNIGSVMLGPTTMDYGGTATHFVYVPNVTFMIGQPSTGIPPALAPIRFNGTNAVPFWHAKRFVTSEYEVFGKALGAHGDEVERLIRIGEWMRAKADTPG